MALADALRISRVTYARASTLSLSELKGLSTVIEMSDQKSCYAQVQTLISYGRNGTNGRGKIFASRLQFLWRARCASSRGMPTLSAIS